MSVVLSGAAWGQGKETYICAVEHEHDLLCYAYVLLRVTVPVSYTYTTYYTCIYRLIYRW